MEKYCITITINGKTWKGKPEEFAKSFEEWRLADMRTRTHFNTLASEIAASDEMDRLMKFLQSYGE